MSTPTASTTYAAEVARLLWPEPWDEPRVTRSRRRAPEGRRDVYLFPTVGRPRLLVPADLPGSSVMVRRLGGPRSGLARPARRVLEASLRTRAFPLLGWPRLTVQGGDPAADSIERHLSESLGTEVRVGVLLGTRRVNQKPVLQVFGADGAVLGYAKVGHNDLTADLVRQEAAALVSVAAQQPRTFVVPEVLHHGRWSGLEVLVMSALPTGTRAGTAQRVAAAREVADLGGRTQTTVATGDHLTRLLGRVLGVEGDARGERVLDAVETLAERHGDDVVELGGWHGDWGHWNMGVTDGVLHVWDWERHEQHVPVGFDELHFAAQAVRPGQRAAGQQERDFLASVDGRLAALGVPAERRRLTLLLYLADMATRYLEALEHGATPALRLRTDWITSLLEVQLGEHRPVTNGAP
ncbi:hypothetical protein [Nocardioides zeicaulis]|uniref:Aminoglycoside phosphotransferase domain-containing protein n=1 Tax=Nocardioides zeicaulis TaxID=1776857 RepID=A0ABV6DZ42_9ACTN